MLKDTKIIVIFGGVYSSLGKGICASSICRILREIGNNVTMMKLEPYLNVDPGLMSPYQHGEVYVTYDGGETDLDLGSYERIGGCNISKKQYLTSGFVYNEIITQERNGEYNGKTVQVVPHVTGKIKEKIFNVISSSKEHLDFLIIEVGGTVGDLESLAMVESLCEIQKEVGKENFLPILLAPLIHLQGTSGELKTKPAQHAYRELYKLGIVAEMMILRTDCDITEDVLTKMSFHCHIPNDFVFSAKTLSNVYFLPENFYEQKIHESIYKYFKLKLSKTTNINNWLKFTQTIKDSKKTIKIAFVGKYIELHDSYASVIEAIKLAGWEQKVNIEILWVQSDPLNDKNIKTYLKDVDGILVPGGFGGRGTDGIMVAIKYARTNKIPYLGICYGMQLAMIEFARNVLGWKDANTTEIDPSTTHPIFKYIDGRMRLGAQKCIMLDKNNFAAKLYNSDVVVQRHRHRWEFNNDYLSDFAKKGFFVYSVSEDSEKTAEMAGIKEHPFFFGGQFHPEFSSKPEKNDPTFVGLVKACLKNKK